MEEKRCPHPGCGHPLPDHLFDFSGEEERARIICPKCNYVSVIFEGKMFPIAGCLVGIELRFS